MLPLSDLSGPGMAEGFESYPLPAIEGYALARTWYASEMERPGCVWTHTLILRRETVGQGGDLSALLALFRRPTSSLTQREYQEPLHLDVPAERGGPGLPDDELAFAGPVIASLYGEPEHPVVLGVGRALEAERLFLAIWEQQWPALRQTFTFCTGSLASRSLQGKTFDLQAAFTRDLKRFAKVNGESRLLVRGELDRPVPCWAKVAAADLGEAADGAFSRFFRSYAARFPPDRALFPPLAECYRLVAGHGMRLPGGYLLDLVAESYPEPASGEPLKVALFGPKDKGAGDGLLEIPEPDLLRELCGAGRSRAFDGQKLAVQERARALWSEDWEAAAAILGEIIAGPLTPLGKDFLAGVAEVVAREPLRTLFIRRPDLVGAVLDRNPSLATNPEVWSLPLPALLAFLRVLGERKQHLAPALPQVAGAAFASGRGEIAREFVREMGAETVPLILDWVDAHPAERRELAWEWREVFRVHARASIHWLASRPSTRPESVLLLTTTLDPGNSEVREQGCRPWLRDPPSAGQLSRENFTRVMTFYLSLALASTGADAADAAALSFDPVYWALEHDALDRRGWELLRDHLPGVPWWRDWDRCDRLRQAVVERFTCDRWPASRLFDLTRDDRIFRQLVESFRDSRPGWQFLRGLVEDAETGRLQAVPERLELIR